MCGCECCISTKSIHASLLSWRDSYLKKPKIKAKMLKAEGLVRNHITYIQHIKIQGCPMSVIFIPKHLIWKMQQRALILVLIMHFHIVNMYCGAVPNVLVLILLTNKKIKNEETKPSIRFHIYHIIGRCTTHGRIKLKYNKICYMCKQ